MSFGESTPSGNTSNSASIGQPPTSLRQPDRRRLAYQIARCATSLAEWLPGRPSLDLDALEAAASREINRATFHDTSFREPLKILLRSLATRSRLNSVGRMAAFQVLRRVLVNRLSLEQAWGGFPPVSASASTQLAQPVYILGLPRTGTTLLLHLLAADPQARPLRYWESMAPLRAPGGGVNATTEAYRKKWAMQRVKMIDSLAPGLASIHRIEALGPEECLWLLENTLHSHSFPLMWNVPEYLEWLEARTEEQWTVAYQYYLATLQQIQGDVSGRHWVLKCPLHAPRLSTIARLVPNACFIQTYRDVGEIVASSCSLAYETHRVSSDHVDPMEIGRMTLRTLARSASESAAGAAAFPDRVFNVHYKSLVKRPLETVRAIYERFQLPWTKAAENAMTSWIQANPQGKHGRHAYSLAQFGLEHSQVATDCEAYHSSERQLAQLV